MKLTIYGRDTCPYCIKAKELACRLVEQEYFDDFEYIEYEQNCMTKHDLSKIARHEIKTVPVVLINDLYIGGYSDLAARYPI